MIVMAQGPKAIDDAVAMLRQARREAQDSMQTASVVGLALALDRSGQKDEAKAVLAERVRSDAKPLLADPRVTEALADAGVAHEADALARHRARGQRRRRGDATRGTATSKARAARARGPTTRAPTKPAPAARPKDPSEGAPTMTAPLPRALAIACRLSPARAGCLFARRRRRAPTRRRRSGIARKDPAAADSYRLHLEVQRRLAQPSRDFGFSARTISASADRPRDARAAARRQEQGRAPALRSRPRVPDARETEDDYYKRAAEVSSPRSRRSRSTPPPRRHGSRLAFACGHLGDHDCERTRLHRGPPARRRRRSIAARPR